jgi:hypothetical protein
MTFQRSLKVINKPKRFRESPGPVALGDEVLTPAVKRPRKSEPCKPIAVEPLPQPTILENPLADYHPPLKLINRKGRGTGRAFNELPTFKKLLKDNCINYIFAVTNFYAE